MTLQCGDTVLRLHPMLLFLSGISVILGNAGFLLPVLTALLIHEAGHFLACRCFGLSVSMIEITPFGGMMQIDDMESAPRLRQFLVALGGPLFSLLGLLLLPSAASLLSLPYGFTQPLARQHLLLLLFNLLPVLPLDGGRMMKALLLSILRAEQAEKLLIAFASAAALALCLFSVFLACRGQIDLAPAFSGFFLLYAAWAEQNRLPAHYVSALIGRRQQLRSGRTLPVRALAVSPEMTVSRIAARLSGKQYHEIWVLSPDGMEVMGKMDEKTFCDALFSHGNEQVGRLL